MPHSPRKLDLLGGISVVVGSILGTGIFIAPGVLASFSSSPWVAFAFWLLGGLVCAIGAAIYGRLGLRFPSGGGQYIYLRESLGPRFSRLYGWTSILVICPTMLAGTALFFAEQWKPFFVLSPLALKLIAAATVALFTLLNTRGIHLAGSVQKGLVLMHVLFFVAVLALAAYLLPGGHLLVHAMEAPRLSQLSPAKGIFALAVVLWAFEGFNSVTFLTNEIEDGERNVHRIGLGGCALVLALYLLFNLLTLANIPAERLSKAPNAALALMNLAVGAHGAVAVLLLTLLGIATVLHTSVIIGPRIIRATAEDGTFFPSLARLSPATHTPNRALWFQCGAVLVFLFLGRFDSLITSFIVLNWTFYGLTVFGYLKLRLEERATAGTRIWLDLLAGTVFLLMVGLLLSSQFLENPRLAAISLVVLVAGTWGAGISAALLGKARAALSSALLPLPRPGGRAEPEKLARPPARKRA